MVAIVSGNSLGLSLTSLATLGQRGVYGQATQGQGPESTYVNVANGNLVLQDADDYLASVGLDVTALRTYNSQGLLNDDNGDNWTPGVFKTGEIQLSTGTINAVGSALTRTAADGAQAVYNWDAANARYLTTAGAGAYDYIKYDTGTKLYTWTDADTGTTETYKKLGSLNNKDVNGLITATDAAGNTTNYMYDGSFNLKTVTGKSGETFTYTYNNGKLTSISTTPAGGTKTTRVSYVYDTNTPSRLSWVTVDHSPSDSVITDNNVFKVHYEYDGTSTRVSRVSQGTATQQSIQSTFTYWPDGRIKTVTDGLNQTTAFDYSVPGSTTVTDPMGYKTVYAYDADGQLTGVTDPLNRFTRFEYTSTGDLWKITDAMSQVTTMTYDANGNQRTQQDAAGNTISRTFDARNQLTTETVNATASQSLTTRYVYDSTKNLLRFVLSPQGRVTEYRYDQTTGIRTSSLQYVADAYDTTGLATTDTPALATMTTWAGTRGAQVMRTDFSIDARGLVATETRWAKVDANGNGSSDGNQSVTTYVYDYTGRLVSTTSPTAGSTAYAYDGLGRILSTQNALNETTTNVYNDATNTVQVTLANGLVTTSTLDAAGRLINVVQGSLSAKTSFTYDADNRLVMTEGPRDLPSVPGVRTWMLYDKAGQKVADVDGNGTLTEYVYNADGLVTHVIVYSTAVDLTKLVDGSGQPLNPALSTIRPAGNGDDQHSWRAYDQANRLARTIDASGAVTQTIYDGASRVVAVTRYATAIATGGLGDAPAFDSTIAPDPADRTSRNLYDGDGLLVASLDAEGYLTEFLYNAGGQLVRSIGYYGATDASKRAAGTLPDLRPALQPASDAVTTYLRDTKGQLAGIVDAEGYLTENVYDKSGNLAQTVRYVTKPTATVLTTSSVASLRPAGNAEDQSTARVYDKLNRVSQETDFQGTVTQYTYDKAGNLLQTVRAAGTAEVRTLNARFDQQGHLTGELTAEGALLLTGNQTQAQIDLIWTQWGLTHTYDAAGRRTSTTDQNANKTLFFYNADGQLTHTVNALGEVTENEYNTLGQLKATVRYGTRISLAGLSGGLVTAALTTAINAVKNGAVDSRSGYTYTRTGALDTVTDALGFATNYVYNTFGEEKQRTLTLGAGATYVQTSSYDRRGLLRTSVADVGGFNATTQIDYDAFGRVSKTTDAKLNVRTTGYDRLGRQVSTVDALLFGSSATYDAFGRTATQTDALGNVTTYTYNKASRSVEVKSQENVKVTTVFTRLGQTLSVTDGRGNTTTYSYDKNGNQTQVATPDEKTTLNAYDRAGLLLETTDPNGNKVAFKYDAANRLLTRTADPLGLKLATTYTWDAKGQQLTVTDANGTLTQLVYDLKGQLVKRVVDPTELNPTGLNLVTLYEYDGQSNVVKVTAPGGTVTAYTFDKLGRRIAEVVDPATTAHPTGLNITRSWTYDATDNVTSATDPNGHVTYYSYDAEGQLVQQVDPMGAVTAFQYDRNGNLIERLGYATRLAPNQIAQATTLGSVSLAPPEDRDHDAHQRMLYDRDNRLVATAVAQGKDTSGAVKWAITRQTYDDAGNVTSRTGYAALLATQPPAVDPMQTGFAAWINSVGANAAQDHVERMAYDALNRLVFDIDPVNTLTKWIYDGNGNVVQQRVYAKPLVLSGDATVTNITNALSTDAGDRITRTVYDAANRVAFTIDAVGGLTKTEYDPQGNITTRRHANAFVTQLDVPPLQTVLNTLVKDDTNDRVEQRLFDRAGRLEYVIAGGNTTHSVYDARGNLWQVIEPGGRVQEFYYDAAGRMTSSVDAMRATESYTYDALGNKLTFTNKLSTAEHPAVWTYEYDAAGRLKKETAPAVEVTTVTFDANGNATGTPSTAQMVTEIAYDAFGNVASRTEAAGTPQARTTEYKYDAAGRQVKTQFPSVNVYLEGVKDLEVNVAYDAFGNAVNNQDVAGRYSYKVYDKAGRVLWDVDAKGQVTGYTRNAFGDVSELKRYSLAIGTGGIIFTPGVDDAFVKSKLPGSDPAARTLTTQYDTLGRAVKVIEPQAYVFDPNIVGGENFTAARTTATTYNALGDVLRVSVYGQNTAGARVTTTADTYFKYDILGRKTEEVAVYERAMNANTAKAYLTTMAYDAVGNLKERVEYARSVTVTDSAWSASTGVSRTAVTAVPDDDRKVTYDYYLNNLKKSETRVNVLYANAGAATNTRGDEVTYFEYDVLGNATRTTDALETVTDTTYDVLGRVTSVRTGPALTEFKHDIYGNVVQRIDNGATDADDRVSFTVYDNSGHAVRNVDALSNSSYTFYDRYGHVARQEQKVTTSVNGAPTQQTAFTEFSYDALGQVIETKDALGSQLIDYNAFSEVIHKGVNGEARHEHYEYDNAGHLWRTNAGDGVYKVALYDIAGRQTADIRSAVKNLASYANAAAVVPLGDLVRTDTRYDLLGHVVSQTRPMQYASEIGSVEGSTVNAVRIVSVAPLKVFATMTSVTQWHDIIQGDGVVIGYEWQGTNSVDLTWGSLAGLGSGDVQVVLTYRTAVDGATQVMAQDFSADLALTGAKVSWDDTEPPALIDRIQVFKKGDDGNWTQLIDRAQTGDYGNQIRIHTPAHPDAKVWLQYRKAGAAGYTLVPYDQLHRFGDAIVFDASGLPEGNYDYEVLKQEPGEANWSSWDHGTMTVISPASRRRITELFVAVRNRAPDAAGLAKYLAMYQAGTSLAAIAQELCSTPDVDQVASPYTNLTGATFVKKFYTMVLGRPDTTEGIPQEDLDFWVAQLGTDPANRGATLVSMIAATTGYTYLGSGDPVGLNAQRLFNNKVEAGLTYAVDFGGYDIAVARTVLAQVTSSSAAVSLSTATTTLYRTQVCELYVLLYNRAPDKAGLDSWSTMLSNGTKTLAQVAQLMYDCGVPSVFSATISNNDLVTSIYQNALGRSPDTQGLNAWVQSLSAAGAAKGAVFVDMVNAVTNYAGTDSAGLTSQQLFKNKVAVAEAYMNTALVQHASLSSDLQIAASKAVLTYVTAEPMTLSMVNAAVTAAAQAVTNAQAAAAAAAIPVAAANAEADAVMRGVPASPAVNTQIAQLYVLLFNRAPDYDGLTDWRGRGLSAEALAQAIYGSGQDLGKIPRPDAGHEAEIITSFYTKALRRSPDAEGLTYWTSELVKAQTSTESNAKGKVLLKFIETVISYGGTDNTAIDAKKLFNNKVAVALAYTTMGGNDINVANTSTASYTILDLVTASDIGVATAQVQAYIDAATAVQKLAIAAPAIGTASTAASTAAAAAAALAAANSSAKIANTSATAAHNTATADYRLEIARLYAALYSSSPSLTQLNNWVTTRSGTSAAAMANQMLGTNEVKNNGYPTTLTATQFVTRVYQLALGRDPDTDGLNTWVNALNSNGNNRGAVVVDILDATANYIGTGTVQVDSQKYLASKVSTILAPLVSTADSAASSTLSTLQSATATKTTTDTAYNSPYKINVCQMFEGIMGRAPLNASEVNTWAALFNPPATMQAVVTNMLTNAPEAVSFYGTYGNGTTSNVSNEAWVTKIYQRCLGRDPDAGGFDSWTTKLNNGMSRGQAANEIIYTAANYTGTDPLGIWSHDFFVNRVNGYSQGITDAKTAADSAYTTANNAYLAAAIADNGTQAASTAADDAVTALTKAIATRAPNAAADAAAAALPATSTAAIRLEVAQLFTSLYARAPSLTELNAWADERIAGKTAAEVATMMLGKPEVQATGLYPATLSNQDFVKQIYKLVVNVTRTADTDPGNFWLNQLNGGTSRGQMVVNFNAAVVGWNGPDTVGANSKKYYTDRVATFLAPLVSAANTAYTAAQTTAAAAGPVKLGTAPQSGTASAFTPNTQTAYGTYYLQADQLYLALRGRTPTAGESTTLANQLAGGQTVIDAATAMLAGNSLYPSSQTDTQFIDTFYRTALGRPADAEGLAFWSAKLQPPISWSRGRLVYELIGNVYIYAGMSAAGLASQALFNNNTYAALYTVAGVSNATRNLLVAQAATTDAALKVAQDVLAALQAMAGTNIGTGLQQQGNDGTVGGFTQYGLRPKIDQTVDRWGNVVDVTDARNKDWKSYYTYNANNQLLATYRSDNFQTIATENFYDKAGRLIATRDGRSNVNRNAYDERGNLIEERHADGGIVQYDLNIFGERETVRPDQGPQTHYTYDKLGHVKSTTRAYGQGVETYYAIGVGGAGVRLSGGAEVQHIQLTENYAYDELGRRISTLNVASGDATEQVYNLRGNLTESIETFGADNTYKRTTHYGWDAYGHKTVETTADGASQGWGLDAWGRVKTHDSAAVNATGTTTTHTDFSYNALGQLGAQTSYRDQPGQARQNLQNLAYTYDNASGLLVKIEDKANAATTGVQVTQYAYDQAGNRTREKTSLQKTLNGTTTELDVAQDNHLSYDRLGRLAAVTDSRYSVSYVYDENGNRTEVHTHYLSDKNPVGVSASGPSATTANDIDTYNAYDAMNRQTIVDGVQGADGQATIGQDANHKALGQRIAYDHAGNRTSMQQWGKKLERVTVDVPGWEGGVDGNPTSTPTLKWQASDGIATETYQYDAAGRLSDVLRDGVNVDTRRYDTAGREVLSGGALVATGQWGLTDALRDAGVAADTRYSAYRADGLLAGQSTRGPFGENRSDIAFDEYDALGRLQRYHLDMGAGLNYYTYSYQNWDHAKVQSITVRRGDETSVTRESYDTNGNLVQVETEKEDWKVDVRTFVNDADGRVLRKTESGYSSNAQRPYTPDVHVTTTLIANGEVLGSSSDDQAAVTSTFRSSYVPVTDAGYSAGPTAYTVQPNDTLQTIARNVWGNADLWYLIADANGIDQVTAGDVIMIPAKPNTIYNSTSTFKPYDPTQAIGDTTPTLPAPQSDSGCGGMGQIIMIVVAVVVTIYTAGALAGAMAPAGTCTAVTGLSTMEAGMAVMTGASGLSTGAAFAAAAVGGAAGSVASQVVGNAIGAQDGFSWKGVALGALGAGVTAGVGAALGPVGSGVQGFDRVAQLAGRAALSNVVSQGIGVVTGLQGHFDWRGVAASAVGAGVGQAVGGELGKAWGGTPMGDFAARAVTGLVAGTTAAVMRGGRISVQQVATDAFGNALGESLAYGSSNASAPGKPEWLSDDGQALVDAVNGFSQAGGGTSYPGVIVGGGERDEHIARMLRLANNSSPVEVTGVGWTGDFQLGDGTWVLKNAIAQDDPRRMITNLPHDAEVPGVPGYLPDMEERYPTWKDVYYRPGAPDNQAAFRRIEIEQMNAVGTPSFQEVNDQRVIAGNYDRFSEIGRAWSSGNMADMWRHVTFEASPQARDVAIQRSFPAPHPDLARIERMADSPIGTIASGIGRLFGASQQRQDALLMTGSLLERLGGAGSQVYKQTLTAPSPIPGALASRVRGTANPLDVGPYAQQAARSVRDGMSPDHIPSFAAIRMHVERTLNRALTPQEATELRNSTTTLMVETGIHQQASRTYGGRNTPAQIARDSLDLQAAAIRDQATYRQSLRARGYSEQQIDAAFERIHAANREKGWY